MKRCRRLVVPLVLVWVFWVIPAESEGRWWEKAIGILGAGREKTPPSDLSLDEMGGAFKEALRIGSEHVVGQLGRLDGFNGDSAVRIPLPKELNKVKTMLTAVGMSGMVDDLELKLNRAAEAATPKAKALFWQSIQDMSFEDVKAIYTGPDDSATRYFQGKMSPALGKAMGPIVSESLSQVGAVQAFDSVMGKYQALPFVPNVKADLTDYVVQKGMDGIFYYLAKEEAAIRKDPLKQTTALLRKVFGVRR